MAEKKNTPIVVSLVDDTGEPICPFCGGKYAVRGTCSNAPHGESILWYVCSGCYLRTPSFYSNQEADAYIRGKKRV